LQSSTVSFRIDETATIPLYPQVIQRTLNVSEQNFVTGSALRTTFQCVAASQAFIDFFSSPGSLSTEGVERGRYCLIRLANLVMKREEECSMEKVGYGRKCTRRRERRRRDNSLFRG
jgi:hypothetical protein